MRKSYLMIAAIMLLNFYAMAKADFYSFPADNHEYGGSKQKEPGSSEELSLTTKPVETFENNMGSAFNLALRYSETYGSRMENDSIVVGPKIRPRNNAFYFTLAPDLVFWAAGIYYERIVYSWEKGKLFARLGYQGWVILLSSGGDAILFQPGIITGNKSRHFEAALGVTYITSDQNDGFIAPAVSVGFRHQKPNKGFIFRTGIGYPDGIYVSFGIGF